MSWKLLHLERLAEIERMGTGAVEIKSGYGLTVDAELKILRVIQKLRSQSRLIIRSTFLGAHALPLEYRQDRNGYIKLITDVMLPQIADEGLVDYCDDVFAKMDFSRRKKQTPYYRLPGNMILHLVFMPINLQFQAEFRQASETMQYLLIIWSISPAMRSTVCWTATPCLQLFHPAASF